MEAAFADPGRPGRVLFVDDDPDVRNAVARSLRRRGFILDVAADGQEALGLATAYPYFVVATDHVMPGISGLELVQRLQTLQPDCSFVMITGVPEQAALLHRVPFVSAVLPKPWDDDQLALAIDKGLLDAKRRLQRRHAPTKPTFPATGKFALLVEDDDADAQAFQQTLQHGDDDDYRIVRARSLGEAVRLLSARAYDAIFADLGLADAQGVSIVHELQARAPDTPILIVTDDQDDNRALSSMQSGAQDYLVKGSFDRGKIQRACPSSPTSTR
jgi:DNA-binding NtrC family response regulator